MASNCFVAVEIKLDFRSISMETYFYLLLQLISSFAVIKKRNSVLHVNADCFWERTCHGNRIFLDRKRRFFEVARKYLHVRIANVLITRIIEMHHQHCRRQSLTFPFCFVYVPLFRECEKRQWFVQAKLKLSRCAVILLKQRRDLFFYFNPSTLVNYSKMETRKPTRCFENVSLVFPSQWCKSLAPQRYITCMTRE